MAAKPPFVIHVNEMPLFPDAVYIGRAMPRRGLKRSKWANPYKIGFVSEVWETDLETGKTVIIHEPPMTRADVLRAYREMMEYDPPDDIEELTGKPLACWCRRSDEERTDDNACHGDVLVELWKERFGDDTV